MLGSRGHARSSPATRCGCSCCAPLHCRVRPVQPLLWEPRPTCPQGAGAYGFDPLFSKTKPEGMGCLTVPSPATGQMTCAFWSDQPFNISFCSNTSYIPW